MVERQRKLFILITGIWLCACSYAFGITHTATTSGNWSDPSIWSQSTVPTSAQSVEIVSGQTITVDITNASVYKLTVDSGATLTFLPNTKLTINSTFTVNGTVTMNGGDITLSFANTPFILGPNSSFTWQPAANTAAGATLFLNGVENFASTSTLIIKEWYNYTTLPLGNVVTGNFGNVVINTNSSGTILEWNQNDQFETHKILGTLTVDQGWVTLDKSGAISNTTIGNIILTSANSYFTAYNGTAAPNFSVNTSNITNNGGTFFGIYDGNGNITLNVTGNVTTTGNLKLIDNDGSMGTGLCDGNATLFVGDTLSQSAGDTRFIYNLYSTTSGTYNAAIGTLNLTGGILMGQYSCHTAGATSVFTVLNNCTLNMPNTTDKFRCIGLSNIGSNLNNQKLNFTVDSNLIISGNAVAEFTSNASSGDETDSIEGNVQFNNGLNSFNYGNPVAAHKTLLIIGGNVAVNGGFNYLSRIAGSLISTINGTLTITNGNLVVKGDTGVATLTINGGFNQSGGKFYHHSNYSSPTSDVINVIINGNFNQSSGSLYFDDCSSSTAGHVLAINGSYYNLSGGAITSASANAYSNIYFGGNTQFNRLNNAHSIQQVKQYIKNGSTLTVNTGNFQLASSDSTGNYFLTILNGGTLIMNANQLFSNGIGANCAIQVDSGGTLKTACPQGLYDGTAMACINASNNMDYYLDPNSTIEYDGSINQAVTGTGAGSATSVNHQYGILTMNCDSIAGADNFTLTAPNVYIRTQLNLVNGEFNLNGFMLTVESGVPTAITRTGGYIKSETNAAYNPSILMWQNVSGGMHVFPFGADPSSYIPVYFTATSGIGGNVSVSTRATLTADKTPLPLDSASALAPITLSSKFAENQVINRWWAFNAPGFTANVTLSYRGTENEMNDSCATGSLTVYQWNGLSWNKGQPSDSGVISGVGTVTINNTNLFSIWMVAGQMNYSSVNQPVDTSQATADNLIILSLGPNPFSNQFSITYTLYQTGPVTIQLADQSGKLITTQVISGVAGSNNFTFNDIYNLIPGIYFFYMTYANTTTVRKIIKS